MFVKRKLLTQEMNPRLFYLPVACINLILINDINTPLFHLSVYLLATVALITKD